MPPGGGSGTRVHGNRPSSQEILPHAPRDRVPAEVERAELDVTDGQLLHRCDACRAEGQPQPASQQLANLRHSIIGGGSSGAGQRAAHSGAASGRAAQCGRPSGGAAASSCPRCPARGTGSSRPCRTAPDRRAAGASEMQSGRAWEFSSNRCALSHQRAKHVPDPAEHPHG